MAAMTPPPTSLCPSWQKSLEFDADLVRKYDGFGPRYTSYPTADRFHEGFGRDDYLKSLRERSEARPTQPLSLYVHVPFCNTICFYCGCNKIITRNRSHSEKYVDYLQREIAMVAAEVHPAAPVSQLHWGGGTPTFLAQSQMSALMDTLRRNFAFGHDTEISIEVDPRKVEANTVGFLARLGFNRISIGVQDFDPEVQKAVNRVQSEAETRTVIDAARAMSFVSVNLDLIYGLPRQTVNGFAATLDKVIAASPDRVALYSYAHLPHLFKSQRQINEAELPSAEVKLEILGLAIERLSQAGYCYIGMDHFAKPDDELAIAQRERKLHRNFQGYSTRPDCDLLGFGVSAIGKVGNTYAQNVKTLDLYYSRLDAERVPIMRGIALDRDDLIRREAIQRIMCDFALDFAELEASHGIAFESYFERELAALKPLAADGLVELADRSMNVTPRGRLLVRNVAMQFDCHLRKPQVLKRFSRVI
jgi:oxygen-independent coproporphyrinogen-3 oxidase